jgi:hypothetical protein
MRQMYLITLLKSGVKFLVEILITACKLMSVKEGLYLLLLIFKQEKLCSQTYVDPNIVNIFPANFFIHGKLFDRKSTGSCLGNREYGRRDSSRWPRGTLYPQNLALNSLTSGGRSVGIVRSRTQATEFSCTSRITWCHWFKRLKWKALFRKTV